MTDLEISKALALAIGWKAGDRIYHHNKVEVWWHDPDAWEFEWRIFDYRDWAVIGPIAERYNAFPYALTDSFGRTGVWNVLIDGEDHIADTPQKAIAMAVIGAKK